MENMGKVKKIDIHVHSVLRKGCPRDSAGGTYTTPDELRKIYDLFGIEKGVQLPGTSPECGYQIITSEESQELAERFPDTYYWYCYIDPRQGKNSSDMDFTFMLEYYKSLGAKGVGEMIANMPFDDPMMRNVFKACEKCGMSLTFHIGKQGGDYGIVDEVGLPGLERALNDFPGMKFFGHSQKFWAEISGDCNAATRGGYPKGKVVKGGRIPELMRKYPNLCCDMSAGSGCNAFMRDPDFAYEFMEEFADRLYFGTDICDPKNITDPMLKLAGFLDDAMENKKISYDTYYKISRGNALKHLGDDRI